jgi:Holliday junction resolvase RusA-like endonuclease
VFGRPVSIQNDDGSKPAKFPKWRKDVVAALDRAISENSRERGYILVEGPLDLQIYWLSADAGDASQPDLDNVLKPFIDALNKRIIDDDRQVRRILAEKASIASPPGPIDDIIAMLEDDEGYTESRQTVH